MLVQIENVGASTTPDFTAAGPATQFVSPSWTPPTSGLLTCWLIAWATEFGIPVAPTSVVGNGIPWSVVGSPINDFDSSGKGVSLVVADAAGSSAGTTTFNFADTIQPFMAVFARATRADLTDGAAAAIVRRPFAIGDLATSGSLTFPSPYNRHNGQIAFVWHEAGEATTIGGSWEKLDDLVQGGFGVASARPSTEDYQGSIAPSWTSSQIWTVAGAEIKAERAGARIPYPSVY